MNKDASSTMLTGKGCWIRCVEMSRSPYRNLECVELYTSACTMDHESFMQGTKICFLKYKEHTH